MRKLIVASLFIGICALFIVSDTRAQNTPDEVEIRRANNEAYEAVNEGNAERFFQVVDTAASSFAWYGSTLSERQNPEGLQNAFDGGMSYDITPTNTNVRVYGNAAVITEYFQGTYTASSGKTTPLNMRATSVWVKQDGKWKAVHYHQSPLNSGDQDN